MPRIAERIVRVKSDDNIGKISVMPHIPPMPTTDEQHVRLLVPIRSALPPDFMYERQTDAIYPQTPYTTRSAVNVNTPIRNTALQAIASVNLKNVNS